MLLIMNRAAFCFVLGELDVLSDVLVLRYLTGLLWDFGELSD